MALTEKPRAKLIGTPRQIKAAKLIAENSRKAKPEPLGAVLAKAGYPKSTQLKPARVTKSLTFQELLDRDLSESFLTKKHKNLAKASRLEKESFPLDFSDMEIKDTIKAMPNTKFISIKRTNKEAWAVYTVADNATQTKALELAYKVRGKIGFGVEPPGGDGSEEIREVIFRIRKILPQGGQ